MAYAFCLRFDALTDAAVRALWHQLVRGGASDYMLRLGYPPHLTLATLDQEPPLAVVENAFDAIKDISSFAVRLGGARSFPDTSIAWLKVDDDRQLMDLHIRLLGALPEALVREHYRAGRWTPHVTLQMQGDAATAMRIAGETWAETRTARVVALELVRFPPVTVVRTVALK
jgi:2'-5' RNA ligase